MKIVIQNSLFLLALWALCIIPNNLNAGSGSGGTVGKPGKAAIDLIGGGGSLTPPAGGLTLNTLSSDPTTTTTSTDNTSSQTLQPQPSALLDQPRTNHAAAREIISSRREARRALWQMRNL